MGLLVAFVALLEGLRGTAGDFYGTYGCLSVVFATASCLIAGNNARSFLIVMWTFHSSNGVLEHQCLWYFNAQQLQASAPYTAPYSRRFFVRTFLIQDEQR